MLDQIRVVSVTIGRNIGDAPMSMSAWMAFQADIAAALEPMKGENSWTEIHEGVGEWGGVPEESLKFAILNATDAPEESVMDALREACDRYQQDTVALAVGNSVLVQCTALTPA